MLTAGWLWATASRYMLSERYLRLRKTHRHYDSEYVFVGKRRRQAVAAAHVTRRGREGQLVGLLPRRGRHRGQIPSTGVNAAHTGYVVWAQWAARRFGVAGGVQHGGGRRWSVGGALRWVIRAWQPLVAGRCVSWFNRCRRTAAAWSWHAMIPGAPYGARAPLGTLRLLLVRRLWVDRVMSGGGQAPGRERPLRALATPLRRRFTAGGARATPGGSRRAVALSS